MNRRTPLLQSLVILSILVTLPATAGVVIEMEQRKAGSDQATGVDTLYTSGGKIKIKPGSAGRGADEMIFDGETLLIVDHAKKRCQQIDRKGVAEMSGQLGDAMKQMQAQLEKMPAKQREMMEKMMKDRMPGMAAPAVERRVERGDRDQVGDYGCQIFTMYADDAKVWEVCASDDFDDALIAEAMEGFNGFSEFFREFREAAAQMPLGGMMDSPFSEMDQIEGMPVRVRSFSQGRQTQESVLRSVERQDLEPSTFAAPSGYKTKDLMAELKKRR